ncbi:MAG: chloramphenicol acetyltransferase [Rhodobacteraceae bacterium]|nr:MAG: chloramphenicol acetyltransferase [Paracoccaceae bacterium]
MPRLTEDRPFLHPDCEITDTTFGRYVEIGRGSRIAHSEIGDYSYCDRYADIANATVGKFANIASFTRIGATDHPLDTAACHHFLYRSDDYWDDADRDHDFFLRRRSRRAHVGHDTWIGHGAMIKPEVTLGHGAVVAAGSVVTKDVAPYTIVAGTPATLLRRRQPEPIAERLIALAWWDWSHDLIRATLQDFRELSAEDFLERYEP